MSNELCQKSSYSNKSLLFFLIAIGVIVGSFFWTRGSAKSIDQTNTNLITSAKLIVGYCPTMKAYLHLLDQQAYEFIMLPSSALVLEQLKLNKIDLALIGRKAKTQELSHNTQEQLLIDGYVLIGIEDKTIEADQLSNYIIHSYLPSNELANLFAKEQTIVKHDYLQSSLKQISTQNDLAILKWSEYDESLSLVTPVVDQTKVLSFRSPHLYYSKEIANDIQLANNQDEI